MGNFKDTATMRPASVCVTAPARLHMGFLDLNGSRGRRFGSVGLALDGFGVRVTAEHAAGLVVTGPQAMRGERFARLLLAEHGLPLSARLTIHCAIPEHVGLGSGTQLAIAVGVALSRLHGLGFPVRDIAASLDRGLRSGIGVGAFEQGGFLVDGGKGPTGEPPRIIAHSAFPAHWRVLLILDEDTRGIHGSRESAAFANLPEFPEAASAHLCRLVLMQALPALPEGDAERFGGAIAELQRVVGDHFAPVQGGRFASPRVTEVLRWFESEGIAGVGQSSWGPTGFALIESETRAHRLLRAAESRWGAPLRFLVCQGRNRGGTVDVTPVANRRRYR